MERRFLNIIVLFLLLDVVLIGAYHEQLAHGLITRFSPGLFLEDKRNNQEIVRSNNICQDLIKEYKQTTRFDPENASIWNYWGVVLTDELCPEAIQAFEQAIRIDPDNATYWNNNGVALNLFTYYSEALKSFERAIRIDPNNKTYWYNKGKTLINIYKYDEAIQAFNRALTINPRYIDALMTKADALYMGKPYHGVVPRAQYAKEYTEALGAYYRAMNTSPKNAGAWSWYIKGKELFKGNTVYTYDDALNAYYQAVFLFPENSAAWYSTGEDIYCHRFDADDLKAYNEAVEAYDSIIKMDSLNSAMWYYHKGKAIASWRNHDNDALDAYNQSIQADPNNTEVWESMIGFLCDCGNDEEANVVKARAEKILGAEPWKFESCLLRRMEMNHHSSIFTPLMGWKYLLNIILISLN